MQVIFEAKSQGNTLKLYHHGYLTVETVGPHFGFQIYSDVAEDLIAAIRSTQTEET